MVPKILKNRSQDAPKSPSEESRNKNQEKCKNEQPSIVFGTFLLSAGVENPTNFLKKWCRKRDQNQVRFWSRFSKDFGGFGNDLGIQSRPKMEEKRHQKTERFLDEVGRSSGDLRTWSLPRQPPLAAPDMRALSSQNIRVRTKREERRGKKEERKKGRREGEGRRTRGKRKVSRIWHARGQRPGDFFSRFTI